jgi:hypothetical protein
MLGRPCRLAHIAQTEAVGPVPTRRTDPNCGRAATLRERHALWRTLVENPGWVSAGERRLVEDDRELWE